MKENRLTRFEVARLIGARALQISMGAPVLIKVPKGVYRSVEIAKLEFKANVLPITIKRVYPDGSVQYVKIKEAIENWLKEFGL